MILQIENTKKSAKLTNTARDQTQFSSVQFNKGRGIVSPVGWDRDGSISRPEKNS